MKPGRPKPGWPLADRVRVFRLEHHIGGGYRNDLTAVGGGGAELTVPVVSVGMAGTVTVVLAVTEPQAAVMVQVPGLTPVTRPAVDGHLLIGRSQGDGGVLRGGRGPHPAAMPTPGASTQMVLEDSARSISVTIMAESMETGSTDLAACGGRSRWRCLHAHSLHHAAVAHGKHTAVIGEVDDGVGAAGAHWATAAGFEPNSILKNRCRPQCSRHDERCCRCSRAATRRCRSGARHDAGRAMPPASRQSSAAPRARSCG